VTVWSFWFFLHSYQSGKNLSEITHFRVELEVKRELNQSVLLVGQISCGVASKWPMWPVSHTSISYRLCEQLNFLLLNTF